MDPSRPATPFPDLNLVPFPLPFPKLEPKVEQPDFADPSPPVDDRSGPREPPPPNSNPNLSSLLSPEVHTPLQQLSPTTDEDALFAEYFRLAQLFLSSYAAKRPVPPANGSRSLVPGPQAGPPAAPAPESNGSSSALVVSKRRKLRSAEMVRVSSLSVRDQIYFRDLVRRTRITFESLRALLIREEEKAENLGLLAKRTRADLKAAALMADRDLWLNRDKRIIGAIPGINIGDVFFFRMEICVIGLHGQVQAGIDYVPASRSSSGEPIATSIIVSGGYEDDDDSGVVLIYTGHGGRERNQLKHSINQKLEGGNLALERSMNYGIEIRVIRGIKSDRSPTGKVYVYDGLYKIVECWMDTGKSGFGVYKYKMIRMQGQDEMGSVILKLAEDLKVQPLRVRPVGYLSLDISMGKENFPVLLFNDIDDDQDPLLFEYLAHPVHPIAAFQGKHTEGGGGCECVSNCSVGCCCAQRNGGEFPYDGNGLLLKGKPLIYECGTMCRCPPTCANRLSQKGLRNRLEVFRSRETGWGVRSLDLIRAGAFICEFSGVVLMKQQAEVLSMNGDSLVCPGRFPGRWVEWGDISDVFPDYVPPDFPSLPDLSCSIDVSRARNVACYLSHSCSPNVFVQFVVYDHYNVSYPHLMIFATENIPPLRELSIDYGVVEEWVARLTM